MDIVLTRQHDEGGGQERNCQIWQCTSHATSKSGLWLNILLNVRALIIHPTHGFCTLFYLILIEIYLEIIYMDFCNIWVELRDDTVRLHPILDDLGCMPPHIKHMKLFHSTDTIYLLRNQFSICHLQYIVAYCQWDTLCGVPGSNISAKVVKTMNRETCTWNSISRYQYIMYLRHGASREYLSDAATALFCMILWSC